MSERGKKREKERKRKKRAREREKTLLLDLIRWMECWQKRSPIPLSSHFSSDQLRRGDINMYVYCIL